MLPVPTAPMAICAYCSTNGHAIRECPQFIRASKGDADESVFFSDDKPVYTFPVEDLPGVEDRHEKLPIMMWSPKLLFLSLVGVMFAHFTEVVSNLRRGLRSFVGWRGVLLILVMSVLIGYSFAAPTACIQSSSYYDDEDAVDAKRSCVGGGFWY